VEQEEGRGEKVERRKETEKKYNEERIVQTEYE